MVKQALLVGAALALAACGGNSTSGGGTADSPFVGTYHGTSTATVSAQLDSQRVTQGLSLFVHRDGLVQIGDAESTIYASGPLVGDTVRIESNAAALVDSDCTGTITLAGRFYAGAGGPARFDGHWSSRNVSCFGVDAALDGAIDAARVSPGARASRVFETHSEALLEAFQRAAD